jgi:hypothetical protein
MPLGNGTTHDVLVCFRRTTPRGAGVSVKGHRSGNCSDFPKGTRTRYFICDFTFGFLPVRSASYFRDFETLDFLTFPGVSMIPSRSHRAIGRTAEVAKKKGRS